MKYPLLAALVGALCSSSCFAPDYGPPPGTYVQQFPCEQFTSCGTCTPVLGCGWCQSGDKGICTSNPDSCAGVASFSWTWELAFCPAELDGGASASADAAHEGATNDAGAEAPTDATRERASGAD
jgi:hypothetical protein